MIADLSPLSLIEIIRKTTHQQQLRYENNLFAFFFVFFVYFSFN